MDTKAATLHEETQFKPTMEIIMTTAHLRETTTRFWVFLIKFALNHYRSTQIILFSLPSFRDKHNSEQSTKFVEFHLIFLKSHLSHGPENYQTNLRTRFTKDCNNSNKNNHLRCVFRIHNILAVSGKDEQMFHCARFRMAILPNATAQNLFTNQNYFTILSL